jgi:hypothetical protein
MPALRGKRLALLVGTVASLALIVAGLAAKDRLREQWYIWRLSNADEATRLHAVAALATVKSIRAVPELIRLGKKEAEWPGVVLGHEALILDPVAYAIFQIGPAALPVLRAESVEHYPLRQLITLIESPGAIEVRCRHPKISL